MWLEDARLKNGTGVVTTPRLEYAGPDDMQATKWRAIVHNRKPVAPITERYAFVDNRQLIAYADILNDKFGLGLEPKSSMYTGGFARFTFIAPRRAFLVHGDPSEIYPCLALVNSYKPGLPVRADGGTERRICQNGMMRRGGIVVNTKRHVGHINPMEFLEPVFARMDEMLQTERVLAEALAGAPRVDMRVWAGIAERTPERYHAPLNEALVRLGQQVGETAWADAQAVAEIATHNMRGFAAQNWRDRAIADLVEAVELAR